MPARQPLALTMGEPAGIGGEITLKAWLARKGHNRAFVIYDDPDRLADLAAWMRLDVPVKAITHPREANDCFAEALPVMPIPLAAPAVAGRPDPKNAPAVIAAIEQAVKAVQAGQCAAIVTNPIHKAALYAAGFRHPGHTEFIATLTGGDAPVMMLLNDHLRVVPVTIHVALKDAIAMLTSAMIVKTALITAHALRVQFGLSAPRLAVAGLNPHAGEDGAMGREDIDIIAPAVAELQARGIQAFGPLPPDTLFTPAARSRYDAVIGMYHDQVLIPLKTLDMDHGVNITLGLPVIRTSPDHGTALDIAGTGVARADSLIAAIALAASLSEKTA